MFTPESSPKDADSCISYIRLTPSPILDAGQGTPNAPIVFLHGLASCHLEFSRVTPFLSKDYDLILVDLPGHSGSKQLLPFTVDNAVNALFRLISTKIAAGKAHIVGMSLGGVVGLQFARRYPELVLSLFCTGCAPLSGYKKWFLSHPRLMGGIEMTVGRISTNAIFWGYIGVEPVPGLREELLNNHSLSTLSEGYAACTAATLDVHAEIQGVRIAIVAGEKRDSIEDTKKAGIVLKAKNSECKAFVVKDAVHLWDLQFPELFAQGVRAWVENSDMPKGFEELN